MENHRDFRISQLRTATLAVMSAAVPFGMLAVPEVTGWMLENSWSLWCAGSAGFVAAGAGFIRGRDNIESWRHMILDGTVMPGFAGLAALALLKTAELNMTGAWMANGWIRGAEVGLGMAVAGWAGRSLWERNTRRLETKRLESGIKKMEGRYKVLRERAIRQRAKRMAIEAMALIGEAGAPLSRRTQKILNNLAVQAARGDEPAEIQMGVIVDAVIKADLEMRKRLVGPDNEVNVILAEDYVRAQEAIGKRDGHLKRLGRA